MYTYYLYRIDKFYLPKLDKIDKIDIKANKNK